MIDYKVLGATLLAAASLAAGIYVGETGGFNRGVQSERQRVTGYLKAKANDSTRTGANRISLGRDPKTPYVNFFYAPQQIADDFASDIVSKLDEEKDSEKRLFNLGLHDLGKASGFNEALDFVRQGRNNPFRNE